MGVFNLWMRMCAPLMGMMNTDMEGVGYLPISVYQCGSVVEYCFPLFVVFESFVGKALSSASGSCTGAVRLVPSSETRMVERC